MARLGALGQAGAKPQGAVMLYQIPVKDDISTETFAEGWGGIY